MSYKLTRATKIERFEKFGIKLGVYPDSNDFGLVSIETDTGHNQEFYHRTSTFTYIVQEGRGTFFLDDTPVEVSMGDVISISPGTRIYYKGKLKMWLITSPAWAEADEVQTKARIW